MDDPEVSVMAHPHGYLTVCADHGPLSLWSGPGLAAFDAIGHAAIFHTTRRTP